MSAKDPVETWINIVSITHSNSEKTRADYRSRMEKFCKDNGITPEQILSDYDTIPQENVFRRKYRLMLQSWQADLSAEEKAPTSVSSYVDTISSFFTYSECPLGKIPKVRAIVSFHNRDIEAKEISIIMKHSHVRERAAYALIAQSGTRPVTLSKLRLKHIEDLNKEALSYKVTVPQEINKGRYGGYVTFIGEDAAKCLRDYLTTRPNLTPDSLLFSSHRKPNAPMNIKNLSRAFQSTAQRLRKNSVLDYEVREKGKPSELRLYTLRKFFKRQAKAMGDEDSEYMMGHVMKGSAGNYAPRNPEYYRKRYEELALPYLRLESPTPTQAEQQRLLLEETYKNKLKEQEEMWNRRFEEFKNYVIQQLTPSPESKTHVLNQDKLLSRDSKGSFIRVELDQEKDQKIREAARQEGLTPDEWIRKYFTLEAIGANKKIEEKQL